jgi:hypothetical protein
MQTTFISASVAALIFGIWANDGHAQPVNSFADAAGKWTGVGSRGGKTDLELEPNGKFTLESPLGKQSGMAKIEGGILILPNPNNQGQLKLTRTGDVLEGPYVFGTLTGVTRLTRKGQ